MTTRDKVDHRYRNALDGELEYLDEKREGNEEHKNEHPNNSYQAANQHMVKFKDELKAINEQTALDFESRKNPAEYNLAERKEMLEAVEQAFNKADWNSSGERQMAANDIAQTTFQPMHRRIEMAEAIEQYKLSDEFVEELKKEEIEYLEERKTESGEMALDIRLKDIEAAQRLVEHSKGTFQTVSTWHLDHYRDQFADALYNSDKNPNATDEMGKFLEHGINYYNGEFPKEPNPDGDNEAASDKRQMAEEEVEYDEPSYAEMLTFREMENMNGPELDHAISELLYEKLQHTQKYVEELRKAGHRDAEVVAEAQRVLRNETEDSILDSVEKGDAENFARILRSVEGANQGLALKMWEREGFIEGDIDYRQPDLPEEFSNQGAVIEYSNQVRDLAENHHEDMSLTNYILIRQMREHLDEWIEAMGPQPEQGYTYRPDSEIPPEAYPHPDVVEECLEEAHKLASGLDYLMRGKDPVYWKLNHLDAEERQEKLEETLQEHLDNARQATGNERGETVEFVLETLQANFSRRLESATYVETELLDLQEGKDPAAAFRTSHKNILDEMENITDYARTIQDGTSDIVADYVPERMEEFRFDPDNQMYDHEKQKRNYIEKGMEFSINYQNMLGNGRHNPEGSDEDMKLLGHVTDRYTEAMREIYNNPETFEENIQEAIQCSQIMDGMVRERTESTSETLAEAVEAAPEGGVAVVETEAEAAGKAV